MNDTDKAILEFEGQRWNYAGNKETEIRARFDLSAVRYYQRLTHILDDSEALEFDPQLVRRLQRIRDARLVRRQLIN